MEDIARSLAQRTPPPWDLRLAVLFPFILDGNGRGCSARSRVSRAHLRIGTICSTAFSQNQNENFGFTSTAAGPATTTRLRAACATASCGKDTALALSFFTWLFPKLSTTRTRGLHVVRFHSNSFLASCRRSQKPSNTGVVTRNRR